MKLALSLSHWGAGPPKGVRELVALAEELGVDSMWTSEGYGSDALTPLVWHGANTKRIRLGTAIMQMSARAATATAMAAITLDHLSGGRFTLGIGASGPSVVEGWYGQPYAKPLARTREYVQVLRQAMSRELVSHDGQQIQIPLAGGTGLGKPLRSIVHPYRSDIPILLAAEGPKNVALAAEIADGWIPLFFSPYDSDVYKASLADGFAKSGARRTLDTFEIVCPVEVEIDDDVEAAADRVRPSLALYIGGMGARGANFHKAVFDRMGYEGTTSKIQDLYLSGRRAEAAAAVPLDMVEKAALVGPREKIAEELEVWKTSLISTMAVRAEANTLITMAEILL